MKPNKIYCSVFFILIVITIFGQTSWERITPNPQERSINDIIKIPGTNKLIAVGEGSTVMTSETEGVSWDIYLNPAGEDNRYICKGVYFINENTGFINGGYETILKTIDGGNNWYIVHDFSSGFQKTINEIEFISETKGFAIAENGQLIKSTDTGETWGLIESGTSFDLNVIEFADPENGFIFSEGDEYLKTVDGGETWSVETLQSPISGSYVKDVYFIDPSTGIAIGSKYIEGSLQGFIYKTNDGGNTWTEVLHDENGWYWPSAIDFVNNNKGMVSCNTIMYGCINYVTDDAGDTWVETPMFYYSIDPCRALYYDEEKAIIAGNWGMIAYSENEGETWGFHSNRTFYGEIFDAQFINGEIGFASAINGAGGASIYNIYKTFDGGENWFPIISTFSQPAFYFIDEDKGFVVSNEIGFSFYKTTNGGQEWTLIEFPEFDLEPLCIRFYDEQHGLVCGNHTLLKTSDGGITWSEINTGTNSFNDIEYKNGDDVFICGNSYLLKSLDGGETWEEHPFGSNIHASDIYFKNSNTAYITGMDTILISEDGGETWEGTSLDNENTIFFQSIHFPSEDVGYAVGHGQFESIVKTTNGGESWNTINSKTTSGLNAVYFKNEDNGLAFGENGIVLKTGGTLQLNPPVNFTLGFGYECPNTIFYLDWEEPDLNNTPDLAGFNIYRNDTLLLVTGPNIFNYNETLNPFSGWEEPICYYVTAVYENPIGESVSTEELCGGWLTGFGQSLSYEINLDCYPNPFYSSTQILFSNLKQKGKILIFDQTGKQIQTYPINQNMEVLEITGKHLKPGIYFYYLKTDEGISETKKMIKL
jgi:photosystem II stability/assembly factor-like uncharacterized protein